MKLTESQIRYLIAIRRLSSGNEGVRPSEIASLLGVKRPSVTGMLDILSGMGLINRKSDGTAYFTEAGQEEADALWSAAQSISNKLQPALRLPADTADECALLLLNAVRNSHL